ncbi:hypothetical protein [Paenibacillus sp. P36]|uniref:hypothetical protein n=1 Tax=Paenibacillus sp. P36 TaxID=3342538 RepID=UPI0038B34702
MQIVSVMGSLFTLTENAVIASSGQSTKKPQATVDGKTTVNLPCSRARNEITVEAPPKSSVGDENWLYLA